MKDVNMEKVQLMLKKGKSRFYIAKRLGISRTTLWKKIKSYKNEKEQKKTEKGKAKRKKKYYINWSIYNEGLVKRGEFLLLFDFISDWEEELEKMNSGKVGRPFEFPESFLSFLWDIKFAFKIDYRTTEGIARRLIHFICVLLQKELKAPDFRTIQVRFSRAEIKLEPEHHHEQEVAMDASGYSQKNGGEYRAIRYGCSQRGFIKVHIAVNTKTHQVLSCEVTKDEVHENEVAPYLIREAEGCGKIKKIYSDGGYDDVKVYKESESVGAEAIIRPNPRNINGIESALRKIEEMERKMEGKMELNSQDLAVLERLKNLTSFLEDEMKWKKERSYYQREHVESVFSCSKRIFTDRISSRKDGIVRREVRAKFKLLNKFKGINRREEYRRPDAHIKDVFNDFYRLFAAVRVSGYPSFSNIISNEKLSSADGNDVADGNEVCRYRQKLVWNDEDGVRT